MGVAKGFQPPKFDVTDLSLQSNERMWMLADRSNQIRKTARLPRIVVNKLIESRQHNNENLIEPPTARGIGSKELMLASNITQNLRS
jgi:hypothetical protein